MRIALFCIMDERINFDCFVVDSSHLHLTFLAFTLVCHLQWLKELNFCH